MAVSDRQAILKIAVPVPQQRGEVLIYDYLAGPAIGAQAGSIVQVPLGARHVWGLVMEASDTSQLAAEKLKSVLMLADVPPLDAQTLQFLKQVSRWTLAPFGSVMRLLLNTPEALLPPPEQPVFTLPEEDKSKDNLSISRPLADVRLTPQRQRVYDFLKMAPPLSATEIARETGVSSGVITAMHKSGLLQKQMAVRGERAPILSPDQLTQARKSFILSDEQQQVADAIAAKGDDQFSVHLLDGVTGSGKTEVYFDSVARVAATARQVLILLPEIALTRAWQDRFEKSSNRW